jgi:hypothetical protein
MNQHLIFNENIKSYDLNNIRPLKSNKNLKVIIKANNLIMKI